MSDSLWFQDAILYELRVRSFYDSDGDGIGDLIGLTRRLDYLQDLGITTLWLLPLYPSPLRDDGYDIADYMTVHPAIGTLRDFKAFLKEAHERGLKVVTELVLNHTSDQHPWFQRARRAPKGSRYRNFYVWSDDPKQYSEARIIFTDTETSNWTWDPIAQQYYWHRFFSHQPDLNFDNPEVQKAMLSVVDHWFEMGVDGLRLDAVPYLFERDGTSCENLPETHDFLRELRRHVDRRFKGRMLLAEANQWPEDAVAYFGQDDECHMAFHFPIMPRLYMALRMEDHFPILDILEQTPQIPAGCQWAIFLRNHDELTLEMVTEEERDFMVRAYAADPQMRINVGIRRRLSPLLHNNRRSIELMNALLFSLPGTPVLYYGDEIGMGDNIYLGDRNGVRTPMQWSPDRNGGFSTANPQSLILPPISDPEYHYESVNVENQQKNPSSLLWWTKRIIALRKQFHAFGRGSFEPLAPQNRKILAFIRRYEDEVILVVANLSRFSQYVELDLREFKGQAPLELFGHVEFPRIGDLPYLLTLGPHSFYWFSLSGGGEGELHSKSDKLPELVCQTAWHSLLESKGRARPALERLLPAFIAQRRYFREKSHAIKSARIEDVISLGERSGDAVLAIIELSFSDIDPERYVVPLAFIPGEHAHMSSAICLVQPGPRSSGGSGTLVDAGDDPRVALALLELALRRRKLRGKRYEVAGHSQSKQKPALDDLEARSMGAEQSNTSWRYGERYVGKLLRKLDEGESVELDILANLEQTAPAGPLPKLAGQIRLSAPRQAPATLFIAQDFIPNQGDAWQFSVDEIGRYFERLMVVDGLTAPSPPKGSLVDVCRRDPPELVVEYAGGYLRVAELLARRTAELHLLLARGGENDEQAEFALERFTTLSRRSFYQSVRNLSGRALDLLKNNLKELPAEQQELARKLLRRRREITNRLDPLLARSFDAVRQRIHGDYHLGQILYTGKDFAIIDFEGEPARSLQERRRKRSPLADVAGLIRSFHYAVYGVLRGEVPGSQVRELDVSRLTPWADLFYVWSAAAFLREYLATLGDARLLPKDAADLRMLLDVHLLEKSLYELSYELNNRPGWVGIPLSGVLAVLDAQGGK